MRESERGEEGGWEREGSVDGGVRERGGGKCRRAVVGVGRRWDREQEGENMREESGGRGGNGVNIQNRKASNMTVTNNTCAK